MGSRDAMERISMTSIFINANEHEVKGEVLENLPLNSCCRRQAEIEKEDMVTPG